MVMWKIWDKFEHLSKSWYVSEPKHNWAGGWLSGEAQKGYQHILTHNAIVLDATGVSQGFFGVVALTYQLW